MDSFVEDDFEYSEDQIYEVQIGDWVTLYSIDNGDVSEILVGENYNTVLENACVGKMLHDRIKVDEVFEIQYIERRVNLVDSVEENNSTIKNEAMRREFEDGYEYLDKKKAVQMNWFQCQKDGTRLSYVRKKIYVLPKCEQTYEIYKCPACGSAYSVYIGERNTEKIIGQKQYQKKTAKKAEKTPEQIARKLERKKKKNKKKNNNNENNEKQSVQMPQNAETPVVNKEKPKKENSKKEKPKKKKTVMKTKTSRVKQSMPKALSPKEEFWQRAWEAELRKSAEKMNWIQPRDFIVRRLIFRCTCANHELKNIDAQIKLVNYKGEIFERTIPAGYCQNCNVYFIMEDTYQEIKLLGNPLCRVTDEKSYLKNNVLDNGMNLASESILKQFGYSVSQTDPISENQRRVILTFLMDCSVLTKGEIVSYLDFFIRQRKNQVRYKEAIEKWELDKKFVLNYRIGDYERYGVKSILRK